MQIIYSKEKIIKKKLTIFLAGPSPRKKNLISWKKEAIKLFKKYNFNGTLLIPEVKEEIKYNYIDQIDWEDEALEKADIIIFWIPRDLNDFPGFTTNIEWGRWLERNPQKLILGSPKNTPKMDYINYYADKKYIPRFDKLENIIKFIIEDEK